MVLLMTLYFLWKDASYTGAQPQDLAYPELPSIDTATF